MRILITGASGFLGSHLSDSLRVYLPILMVRSQPKGTSDDVKYRYFDWANDDFNKLDLSSIDVIVNVAALAHYKNCNEDLLFQVNVEGTRKLAAMAAKFKVRRFIQISSAGVYGATSVIPFCSSDETKHHNKYTLSKAEGDNHLKSICASSRMEYVIIRPPLVYGARVKGSFLTLLKVVLSRLPLPLGSIEYNKRSLVFVDNLVDLIKTCIEHPAAANQTFLVSDDDDVSTKELLVRVAAALGVKSRLLNIPPSWLGLVWLVGCWARRILTSVYVRRCRWISPTLKIP